MIVYTFDIGSKNTNRHDNHGSSKHVLIPMFFFFLSLRCIHIDRKYLFQPSTRELKKLDRLNVFCTSCRPSTHNSHLLLQTACGIEMSKFQSFMSVLVVSLNVYEKKNTETPALICCTRLHYRTQDSRHLFSLFMHITLQYFKKHQMTNITTPSKKDIGVPVAFLPVCD